MVKAVFFDVNETVLNLELLKEKFDKYFDDQYIVKYWFTKLLHLSNTISIMGKYENFGGLSKIVLENVFYERGKELTEEIETEILGSFRKLPAYNDVEGALKKLRKSNIRTVAVSNSSLEMMEEQLTNAGIIDLFDSHYSVDSVKKYKPFENIYKYAANQENLSVGNIVMVASHDWDLFGAKGAGLMTAYIKRKEELFCPLYPEADIYAADLNQLVKEIIKIK